MVILVGGQVGTLTGRPPHTRLTERHVSGAVDDPNVAAGHDAAENEIDDPFVGFGDTPPAISGESERSKGD